MPEKLVLQEMIACLNEEKPLRIVVETRSDTKIRRSKDLFGTVQHSIIHSEGIEKPIYGMKIYIESAPGVWIDVLRYLRLGLQAAEKAALKNEK